MRERRRGDDRAVGDAHAVVRLVALLESAQDGDRALDRRLADVDRLEATLERGVLLDVLAILVERGRADDAQLAAREHRLEHLAGVHRAFGLAGADERVQLVDEDDELVRILGELLEHGLEPLLELAAELRAGDQRAEVEREEPLVLEALGHVAVDDALREPLDDGRLADARLADEHGIVLRAAREHLHDASNLLVAPDHGIELALARGVGEVARVLLQRLVLILRRLVGDAVRPAHRLERLEQRLVRDLRVGEQRARLAALRRRRARAEDARSTRTRRRASAGLLLRLVEHGGELARHRGLRVALLGVARDLALQRLAQRGDARAELLEHGDDDALVLPQQHEEQVRVVDDGVAESARLSDRLVERLARLHGEPIGIDHLGIYRSGCLVTTNAGEPVEHTTLGQRRCRISRAALAAEDADAAPLVGGGLPNRR